MSFPSKLKEARLHKTYTQSQVAEMINVPESTYCNYENGTDEPDIFILKDIVIALETTSDELLEI